MDPGPRPAASPAGVRTTRRRGRTSPAKQEALATLLPIWGVDASGPWPEVVHRRSGRRDPVVLDIGAGDGAATLAWARARPDLLVVAIELHRPGLAKLLHALADDGPANLCVTEADATQVVASCAPRSIRAIRLLFPDPWPKRRHVGRRLVDRAFVLAAADALEPGGTLHLATDSDDYADHARTMIATEPRFEALGPAEATAAHIDRPVTVYEARGLAAGRTITELVHRRR